MIFSSHEVTSRFKKKLNSGELVIGTWVNTLRDPMIAKVLSTTPLDYMLIDSEHSGASIETISNMCLIARECGLYPMIRPTDPNDLKMNGRLLDAGACGLVIPHIDSAKQAKAIADSMHYFNGGTRGYSSKCVCSGFTKTDEEAMRRSDAEVTCVVQFESVSAVEQADEIMAIDGIDIAIVGRGDLAHDMGLPGKQTDERVSAMVEKVYAAARRNGKIPGLLVNDLDGALKWLDRGIKFMTYGSETGWLQSAYNSGIKTIRAAEKK